jgi:pimeloyl-ACP methyl ester carboxylesterase
MASSETVPTGEPIEPGDWPTGPERRYARLQADLAAHEGVAVESRAVETRSMGRVHYLAAGDPAGEPVVLCHGVGTTAALFLPLLPALSDYYRVLVPDRPGRGLSAPASYADVPIRESLAAYLVEFLDEGGLDRPHVVGNSLGGLQAFLLAVDHDRVDRLALVGAPGGLSRDLPLSQRLLTAKLVDRALLWLMRRGDTEETVRDQTAEMLVADPSAIPDVFYETFAASQALPGRTRSLRTLLEQQGRLLRMDPVFDISDEVVGVDRPTTFLWGTEDWFWEPAVGRPVVERMPDADLEVLEGHGHMPWLEPTDEVGTRLRGFLDG